MVFLEIMKILLTKKIYMIHIPFKNNHLKHVGNTVFSIHYFINPGRIKPQHQSTDQYF